MRFLPPSPFRRLRRSATPAAIAVAALGLLGACATPPTPSPKYVAPTSGPTAKVAMRGNVASGDIYGVFVFDDAEACKGPRIVGAGRVGRDPSSTTIVAAQPATVDFMLISGPRTCRVRYSFTPAAGHSYLVAGGVVTGVPGASCQARVMDATDPDKIVPVADAVRRDHPGNACLPSAVALARKQAATPGARVDGTSAVLSQGAGDDDLKGLIAP
jgi:hypothetical protein